MLPKNNPTPLRGEIWLINLDPTVGDEIKKRRPGLVLNSDHLGRLRLKIVVPITEWKPLFEDSIWHVPIAPTSNNGLTKESAADAYQIRSVSVERFSLKLGFLPADQIEEVLLSIRAVLQMDN